MKASARHELFELPLSERLQLVQDLWDSIATADVPITPDQREELDRRLASHEREPSAGDPWDAVKPRVVRRK
jgi:putative addiction module component (TIGR02574 family)